MKVIKNIVSYAFSITDGNEDEEDEDQEDIDEQDKPSTPEENSEIVYDEETQKLVDRANAARDDFRDAETQVCHIYYSLTR